MKFKAVQAPNESPPHRSFFRKQKRPDRPETDAHSIGALVQDFRLALDGYRVCLFRIHLLEFNTRCISYTRLIPYDVNHQVTALPMYGISPIEVALHPLGIISHSSCGLEPFLDGILNYKRVMEYRIGTVHTVERYIKQRIHHPLLDYVLFQLVNERGVENWIRLGLDKPISWVSPYSTFNCTGRVLTFNRCCQWKDGASVSFATTKEALTRNMTRNGGLSTTVEVTLPVTGLARQFKVLCDHVNGVDVRRVEESKVLSSYHSCLVANAHY